MIAEILLNLSGHPSSLFAENGKIKSEFSVMLHPGEEQCLVALHEISLRYREIKRAYEKLSQSKSRYIYALISKLDEILRDDYEALIVETETKILQRDEDYVGQGSFISLSLIRAIFAEFDTPFKALATLMATISKIDLWPAGRLIDLLLAQANTGVHKVSSIMSQLAESVQKVWRIQLQAFLVYGTISPKEPIGKETYELVDEAIPSCVSAASRDSIVYVGRAVGTVKSMKWHRQIPSRISLAHGKRIESVLPQEQRAFEIVVEQIRSEISEWLWSNVLTSSDVDEAVDSLANYFLMQNGEFSLSLIREIDKLKQNRLASRSATGALIREQDLHLALLRASLGTSAQHDTNLSRIRFVLPKGPARPLLINVVEAETEFQLNDLRASFNDILLGFPVNITYKIAWPLDLFLQSSDLTTYGDFFSFLSSLRHVHTRVHSCWASLSNAQRARRRWTGLDEGGATDMELRKELLRIGWGVVRSMGWFLDVLLEYMLSDVVETEFRRFKTQLNPRNTNKLGRSALSASMSHTKKSQSLQMSVSTLSMDTASANNGAHLDFTTLRNMHTMFLERLLLASLLTQPSIAHVIRRMFDTCERFVGQVERWGDILPGLLFEGSLSTGGSGSVGKLVKERRGIVISIDQEFKSLLETFYEQLSSTNSQPLHTGDASKTMLMNASVANANASSFIRTSIKGRGKGIEKDGEALRHIERLLLRLDFNRTFSKPIVGFPSSVTSPNILREGGLV